MANREIPGQGGGGLVVADSDYLVRATFEGATIVCRAAIPITISLLNFAVPGADYLVVNRNASIVTLVSIAGDQFADGAGLVSSITVSQNESVHVFYDNTLRQWQVNRAVGVDPNTNGLNLLTLAALVPGFTTEFRILEPNYPYSAIQNIDFRLQRLDATTLRCLATGPIYFPSSSYITPFANTVTLPQQDIPLAGILAPGADGIFIRYVGVLADGTLTFTANGLARSRTIAQLGVIAIKRVAGVVSFLDELTNSPVRTQPNLACVDNFSRTLAPLTSTVTLAPNGANLNMLTRAGLVIGESINWGDETNAHAISRPAAAIAAFYRVSGGTLGQTTLGGAFTVLDPVNYWNGTAVVPLSTATRASVQRILITLTGGLLVQYGEVDYANLADATDAIYSAPFTDALPTTFVFELGRVAMTRAATTLNNNAQAVWVRTGY